MELQLIEKLQKNVFFQQLTLTSSTRRDDLLDQKTLQRMWIMRKYLLI
jgi:transcription termination factor Rho